MLIKSIPNHKLLAIYYRLNTISLGIGNDIQGLNFYDGLDSSLYIPAYTMQIADIASLHVI